MSSGEGQTVEALRIALDPRASREARHSAESYLEQLKSATSGLFNIYAVVQNAHAHCSDLDSAQVYTQLAAESSEPPGTHANETVW